MARAFQEYLVYQRAHEVTLAVYKDTERFPRAEQFGLTSQMRRSALSVPMNIAEGSAFEPREFRRFLGMALGSATELEYQLELAKDLGTWTRTAQTTCRGRSPKSTRCWSPSGNGCSNSPRPKADG